MRRQIPPREVSLRRRLYSRGNFDGPVIPYVGTPCWLWTGGGGRYGEIQRGPRGGGIIAPSKASWELEHGPVPPPLLVCHRCDVKRCFRPDHLFLGTAADNTRDMMEKGRHVARSKLSPEDALRCVEMRASGMLLKEVGAVFGVSESTVCQRTRRLLRR